MAERCREATGGLNLPGGLPGCLSSRLTRRRRRAWPTPHRALIGLLSRLPGLGRRSARRSVLRC